MLFTPFLYSVTFPVITPLLPRYFWIPWFSCSAPCVYALIPLSSCFAPPFNWSIPSFKVWIPSSNSPYFSFRVSAPSDSSLEPSTSFSAASSRSSRASVSSSVSEMLSTSSCFKMSVIATVKVESISKSVTSAVISRLSGSVISFSWSLERFRLSFKPGIATPITIFLLPSDTTFPLSITMLEKCSSGRIIPVTITNGL